MVESITQYKADDGSIWPTLALAKKRESLLDECHEVEMFLGKRPKLGMGTFKQHNMEAYRNFRSSLLALVKKHLKKDWIQKWDEIPDEQISAFGIIGRILSDSSNLYPVYCLWSRLMCFDKRGREWDQPYYALQADKGTA